MKRTKTMLSALAATAIFFSGAVFCAPQGTTPAKTEPVATDKTDPKKTSTENAGSAKATSTGVTPHNHMRDSKGIYVAPKKSAKPVAKPETKTDSTKASSAEKSPL